MHTEIETLLYEAESRYLKDEEINVFKRHLGTLAQRLKVYEFLRDKEATIFQSVANKLQESLPQEKPEVLERSLKQWIWVFRQATMAMLLNDANFLQQHLLDWIDAIVEAHQSSQIESTIYQLLQVRLKEVVSAPALALLQPFLEQSLAVIVKG